MSRSQDIERIVVAAHALTRTAAAITKNDAPAAQWRALSILQKEGAQRVGDLARATRTTQPGMTRLIGQLTEEGLVTRGTDPDDSRATVVSITSAGAAAIDAWRDQLGVALQPMFADLTDEEWSALSHAARILTDRATAPLGVVAR